MAANKRAKKAGSDLAEYRRKRNFDRTAEPEGGAVPVSESGRLYVVQKHAARNLHYDLRLEFDGALKSWAVPKGPSLDPAQKPLAVHVEDHPIEYGSFEGIIPKGEYGGGTVMLWDQGEWEPIGDPVEGYDRGDLKFRLHGEKLRGAWVLARMGPKAAEFGKNWLLIKKRDEHARSVRSFNVLSELPHSVASGRLLDEIAADPEAVWTDGRAQPTGSTKSAVSRRGKAGRAARSAPDASTLPGARKGRAPDKLKPQLATPVKVAPQGDDWLHEIKLDGYRLIMHLGQGKVRLLTRNGHDWTEKFESVARAAARLPLETAVLDGEVVVLNAEGISDFHALQNALGGFTPGRFTYYLFDIPYAQGYDLRSVPLLRRKAFLGEVLRAAPLAAPTLQFSDHIVGGGPVVYEQAARSGLEGIISKAVDSPYVSRRTDDWLKVKCTLRQELIVGGFTDPSGSRTGFGALLLGYHDAAGRLVYCGRVGTGFSDRTLAQLGEQLLGLKRPDPPFRNPQADPDAATVSWVAPEVVVEVQFTAWTNDGLVRHGVFCGVRPDADPREVRLEAATDHPRARRAAAGRVPRSIVKSPASPDDARVGGVRISNPQRTVYPYDGVTKRDVAEYYEKVARWILPHVVKRPLSLVRCPLGLAGESFYQREIGEGFPEAIRGITIGDDHAIVINDLAGLLALVQMGVLEIHPWGCRQDNPEKPDQLIFDLDPGPRITWEDVVESARFVRDYLRDIGLQSFVKTSGGKGIHVVVPLIRRSVWAEAKSFTHAVAQDIVRIAPRNFVATMTKTRREHRIFVDYLRNQRGSTSVAPYSTRARDGATVSTPLRWDELSGAREPAAYTVSSVPKRLAGLDEDPWEGFRAARQSITAAMKRAVGL